MLMPTLGIGFVGGRGGSRPSPHCVAFPILVVYATFELGNKRGRVVSK